MSDTTGEYRIFGPPGTGKTTTLVRQIYLAAEKFGGHNVLCASYTKTASVNLAERVAEQGIQVPEGNVGTVHSLCYRALGSPKLAETEIEDFNRCAPTHFQLSKAVGVAAKGKLEDATADIPDESQGSSADDLYSHYNVLRNRLVPGNVMPTSVRAWAEYWERWKADNDLMDFTDLLERGVQQMYYAPGSASVLFLDEAQDLTPLQFKLVRQWGRGVQYYIVSGDDDQLLYTFAGASPDPLLQGDLDPSHIRVLAQSYRVPRAVHALANSWIQRVSARQPKEYKPRDEQGAVSMSPASFRDISPLRARIEDALGRGETFMLLAAARYQVLPMVRKLREWGIPFHNPYRVASGDWNPIRRTQVDRLKNFLNPDGPEFGGFKLWTPQQLKDWTSICAVGGLLTRGGKAAIERLAGQERWDTDGLLDLYAGAFRQDALDQATRLDLGWLVENMKQDKVKSHEYLLRVLKAHGQDAWESRPCVIVGTIHSVKGGEADTVALFPDLPPSACLACQQDNDAARVEARDSIIRQFYVGMTRAVRELIICSPATSWTVEVVKR